MKNIFIRLFLFCTVSAGNLYAVNTIQYGVDGGMTYYSGTRTQSLAPNSGYLGRFEAGIGNGFFRFTSNFTLVYSQATAYFNDSGSENVYTFRMINGEFNFGVKCYFLYFIAKSPIQPYIGGSGGVQLASLKFTESDDMSATWPRAEARMFYGYNIFAGVDIWGGKKTGVNFHFEQSNMSGSIGGRAFKLSGLRYLFGIIKKL
ncbi:MAG: hypothetical protein JXA66_05465 [Oligoflexia bacterium]|nr:hypothetical protein [Oligoflexia bacterium]